MRARGVGQTRALPPAAWPHVVPHDAQPQAFHNRQWVVERGWPYCDTPS